MSLRCINRITFQIRLYDLGWTSLRHAGAGRFHILPGQASHPSVSNRRCQDLGQNIILEPLCELVEDVVRVVARGFLAFRVVFSSFVVIMNQERRMLPEVCVITVVSTTIERTFIYEISLAAKSTASFTACAGHTSYIKVRSIVVETTVITHTSGNILRS